MASNGSSFGSFGFSGELTPATTPRRSARSIYDPAYASVPPTTPATWSQDAYFNALPNLYPYSQSHLNQFNPSRNAVGATEYGLNNHNYHNPISVADVQRVIADLVVGRAPRPATPVPQASPDDIVVNGVKYVKSNGNHAKTNSNTTSSHVNYQPPSCEPEPEGDDLPGPSRTKGKARADVWVDNATATEADTFSQSADAPGDVGDWNNAVTTNGWSPPPTDADLDDKSAAGTIDNPIHVPGFSDDFLVSVLVGTSAIYEMKVLKSALITILASPEFRDHKKALNNDQSTVLQGIASKYFQSLVSFVYAGYPDEHTFYIMKHYTDTQLVSLYAAGHHFGLQDLCQELIYVLDSRATSTHLFDLVQQVYSDGHADEDFRGLVRRKVVQMLEQMSPKGFWEEFEATYLKEMLTDSDLPSALREDVISVLFDREVLRFDAKKSECAATQAGEDGGWGSSRNHDDSEEGKDEKSLFVTGFPASYKSLDIVNEVMFYVSTNSHNPDVDFSLLRRDDSLEGRYLYVTFSTPEAAIAAFEDLFGQEMGFGVNKKTVFVDFAFEDTSKNFERFAEWKNEVYP